MRAVPATEVQGERGPIRTAGRDPCSAKIIGVQQEILGHFHTYLVVVCVLGWAIGSLLLGRRPTLFRVVLALVWMGAWSSVAARATKDGFAWLHVMYGIATTAVPALALTLLVHAVRQRSTATLGDAAVPMGGERLASTEETSTSGAATGLAGRADTARLPWGAGSGAVGGPASHGRGRRASRRSRPTVGLGPRALVLLAIVMVVPGVLGFYATDVEPDHLRRSEVVVRTTHAGAATGDVRVAVLSDIQSNRVTGYERDAVRSAMLGNPDLVLFAGDVYSGEDAPFPRFRDDFVRLLSGLRAPFGSFVVEGDHDSGGHLPGLVHDAGLRLLDDEVVAVDVRGRKVGILGLRNERSDRDAAMLARFATRADLDVRIVLSHHPDVVQLAPPGIDLVVAGHTHGGQVQLPFIGPVMTLSALPRQQAAGGLFDLGDGRHLFVTRGVGYEHGHAPKVRFGAPPEVDLLVVR